MYSALTTPANMSQSDFSDIQKEKISTSASRHILSGVSKVGNVTVKKWLPALVMKATAYKAKPQGLIEASIARVHDVKAGERITIGAPCASAVCGSSDDTHKYLNPFQMTKFHQRAIQRAMLTDDNKKLTEPLLRKATVQAGKRFLLESTLTKKDNAQLFSWKYEIDGNNGQYRLTYTNEQTSNASSLRVYKGKVSTYLNQENIPKLKEVEESTFQDLCEKYGTEHAKREITEYEWRYIPSSRAGEGECIYSKNSAKGWILFHDRDGLFPGFLKLDVLAAMLTLESPPSISQSAERGSCMAFSAQWLDLMIGGKSKLSEIEATLEQKSQLYRGGLSSNESMTVAQRRMAILSAQNGREAAQYQKAYSGYFNLEADYRERIRKLAGKAFETMRQTRDSLYTATLNAHLDRTVQNQKIIEDRRADLERKKDICEKYNAHAHELIAKGTIDHDADLLQFAGLKTLKRIDYNGHDPEGFMKDLIDQMGIGSGAEYDFGYHSTSDGTNAYHATALFRPDRDTVIFFDPNYGEYHIPTYELGIFLARFLAYKYKSLPFTQSLRTVAKDTQENDLRSLYSESKRAERRKQLTPTQTENAIAWKKNKQGQWIEQNTLSAQQNSNRKVTQLSTATLTSVPIENATPFDSYVASKVKAQLTIAPIESKSIVTATENATPFDSHDTLKIQPQSVVARIAPSTEPIQKLYLFNGKSYAKGELIKFVPGDVLVFPNGTQRKFDYSGHYKLGESEVALVKEPIPVMPGVTPQHLLPTSPTTPVKTEPPPSIDRSQMIEKQIEDAERNIGSVPHRDSFLGYIEKERGPQMLQAVKTRFADLVIRPNPYLIISDIRKIFTFLADISSTDR